MLKFGRHGKPHKAHFKVSEDLTQLSWTSRKGHGPEKRRAISIGSVKEILPGQELGIFKRWPMYEQYASISLSLTYADSGGRSRNLGIICHNPEDYELWFVGLDSIHRGLILTGTQAKGKSPVRSPAPLKDLIGDVYIWGAPSTSSASGRGAAGDTLQESRTPILVNNTFRLDAAAVACGPRHAALITKNGEVYTWGCGDGGRLGHGSCNSAPEPKMVLELSGRRVVQVACGDWHTAAIARDGSLYTWGDGTAGILGHGTPHRQWSPKQVDRPLQGVIFTQVSAGPYHTAAVTKTGELYTWGDGFGGKLGHGSHDTCLSPKRVEQLVGHRVVNVAAGVWHTVCVTAVAEDPAAEDTAAAAACAEGSSAMVLAAATGRIRRSRERGVVWSWGGGDKGCLGVGDEEGRMVPVRMRGGPESVRQVCTGLHFTLLLSSGGKVWQCGSTCSSGYDGTPIPPWEGSSTPVRVKGALGGLIAAQISAGMHHAAAIAGPVDSPFSWLYTWGRGNEGQLGHGAPQPGTAPSVPEPRRVKQLEGRRIIQVACGGCNTAAVVEHSDNLDMQNYENVAKELDGLLPRKHPAPPTGLLVGQHALGHPGAGQSPHDVSGSGQSLRNAMDGQRSRANSILGDAVQSIASSLSLARDRRPEHLGEAAGHGHRARSTRGNPAASAPLPYWNLPESIPSFLCPITHEVFHDPVVASDGYTYERSAIVEWLRTSSTSPMTNMPLDSLSLTPSHSIRSAIEEWKQCRSSVYGNPRGGPRHRSALSLGGSSQGSLSLLGQAVAGGALPHGPVVMVAPRGSESNRSTPANPSGSGDPLRRIGERL